MNSSQGSSKRSTCVPSFSRVYPSLAFSDALSMPYKSPISPPSTTSSAPRLSPASSTSSRSSASSSSSLSPATPPSSISSKSFASTAYPDWPKRDILSPMASFHGHNASSYISDEDLLDLERLELCDDVRVPTQKTVGISWEVTKQPPVILPTTPIQQSKGRPVPKRRRRSSPLNKKKTTSGMVAISEAPE